MKTLRLIITCLLFAQYSCAQDCKSKNVRVEKCIERDTSKFAALVEFNTEVYYQGKWSTQTDTRMIKAYGVSTSITTTETNLDTDSTYITDYDWHCKHYDIDMKPLKGRVIDYFLAEWEFTEMLVDGKWETKKHLDK